MVLKGSKPEPKNKRLKMFLYGQAGIGKTIASLQFPNAYIIDCERGTDSYSDLINKSNSVVLQTLLPDEIKGELKELLTSKHEYRTLIIDPITQVYNAVQEKWTKIFEKHAKTTNEAEIQDFGMRYWSKVKSEFKSIQRMLLTVDMNVIVIAHQKDVYGTNFSKIGTTFDSMRGDDYFFDLIFQIIKKGDKRIALTIKERAEMDKQKFPPEFEWSYANFVKFYGKEIIEKQATPVIMADKETIDRVINMVNMIKMDESVIIKWFQKADVQDWAEMSKDQIDKCEDYLTKKLGTLASKPTQAKQDKEIKGKKAK